MHKALKRSAKCKYISMKLWKLLYYSWTPIQIMKIWRNPFVKTCFLNSVGGLESEKVSRELPGSTNQLWIMNQRMPDLGMVGTCLRQPKKLFFCWGSVVLKSVVLKLLTTNRTNGAKKSDKLKLRGSNGMNIFFKQYFMASNIKFCFFKTL